jgi:thioredoxin-like negative regulator of GroEL
MGDAIARVCAWVDRLRDERKATTARQALQEALDRLGDAPDLVIRLAMFDFDDHHAAQAVELLGNVLVEQPGHLEASWRLASILLSEGKAAEAAAVIDALPPQARAELAELAGEIMHALGRHAEAVEAFGKPASLSRRGRRLRRRSWWRSGGPFRHSHRRTAQSPHAGPQHTTMQEPTDALLEVVSWAEWLEAAGRRGDARQVLTDALNSHGRHPRVLRCLAELEDSDGAARTALYLWFEAHRAAPTDVEIVCGLAGQFGRTWFGAPEVRRFQEALQVLDAFPDRELPEVRATRGNVFSRAGLRRARVAAAYGKSPGLPADAARARRLYRWKSAGPLGRALMRFTDWRRGPWPVPADHPVACSGAESEEIARLLDAIDELSPSTARERIEEAWQQYGRLPSLLLAHADLDWDEDADWQSLVLAAEALDTDPGNIQAACYLARSINYLYDFRAAVKILEAVPHQIRRSIAVRAALGELYRNAGNPAEAVTAYGDPRDLPRPYRRHRRRCVRRGLVRHFRPSAREDRGPFDLVMLIPDHEIARVLDQSKPLWDSPDHGRAVLEAGIADHGRHPLLLLTLATAQRQAGDLASCEALAAEAAANARQNPFITAMAIGELWRADFDAEALRMLKELPEEIEDAAPLQALVGSMCDSWSLPCQAVLAYGKTLLDESDSRTRRACWWRTGGPYGWLRNRIESEEWAVMSDWEPPEAQLATLASLALPEGLETEIRAELSSYRMTLQYRTEQIPGLVGAWFTLVVAPVSAVLTIVALIVIDHLRWRADQTWEAVVTAITAMAATFLVVWILTKLNASTRTILAFAACCAGAAAFLLQAATPWIFAAGLVLATAALAIASAFLTWVTSQAIARIRGRRWRRDNATAAALGALLELLDGLPGLRRRNNAAGRRQWMANTEIAAAALERDLPHARRSGDPESQATIANRARGAADALRALKPAIALADEKSWDEVTTELRTLVTALARDDFMALPEAKPAKPTLRQPRPWWWHAMQITRTVLVILAPPLVAFLLPLLVPLNGPGVAWLRLATLVWALLAAIVALDPGITAKVSQMREILTLWRETGPSQGAASEEPQNMPDGQAASRSRPRQASRPLGAQPRKPQRGTFRR